MKFHDISWNWIFHEISWIFMKFHEIWPLFGKFHEIWQWTIKVEIVNLNVSRQQFSKNRLRRSFQFSNLSYLISTYNNMFEAIIKKKSPAALCQIYRLEAIVWKKFACGAIFTYKFSKSTKEVLWNWLRRAPFFKNSPPVARPSASPDQYRCNRCLEQN